MRALVFATIAKNFKSMEHLQFCRYVSCSFPLLVMIVVYAAINRNDLSLVAVTGFDHKATANGREFLFSGTIDGVVEDDYTVNTGVSLKRITAQLPKLAARLSGTCLGVSTCDDRFEFAVGDLNGIAELYFGAHEEELILSDNFFDVATAMDTLDYRMEELNYFVKHQYCRAG
jgi:hypothetical protein